MSRTEILAVTADFLVADHEYITLIRKALVRYGEPPPTVTAQQLELIGAAKRKRAELEEKMYTIWASNGIA